MFTVGLDVDRLEGYEELCSQKIELYAGSPKMSNFYSPLGETLGKIYKRGESAGNKRDYAKWEELPKVSDHVGKRRELKEEEWGDYIAGLIDGDGNIGEGGITIVFHESDVKLAYELKKKIGYGNVYKLKDKKAYRLVIRKNEGIKKVMEMINGRLRTEKKVNQMIKYNMIEVKPKREDDDLRNYWLAGFAEADGSFVISATKSETIKVKKSVRLEFGIKQKGEERLLNKIKKELKGGSVSYYKSADIHCYKSSGMKTAREVIRYFDEYKLRSNKYVSYLKYRKVYRMITRGEHLREEGIKKIESIRLKGS